MKQETPGESEAFRVFEGDGFALRPLILKLTQRQPRVDAINAMLSWKRSGMMGKPLVSRSNTDV